jgi:7,8-dihydropterin-6-yl-methyl-4-(beta-D-ribofuranosyl)aminobenzene 5'-phosphate synthase
MCQFEVIAAEHTVGGHSSTFPASSSATVSLTAVDSVEVTILVDNFIDILLPSKGPVARPQLHWDWSERPELVAEHGYSLLFTFRKKGESRSVLYDAGLTQQTVVHNLDVLGLKLKDVDAVVLSHGHADHHGGLVGLIRRVGKKGMPLILHPDAWKNRKIVFPSGSEMHMPPPNRRTLEKEDVQIVEERGPSFLLNDEVLVTGEVERVTHFEKGFPYQYAELDGGKWGHDPWIYDDQGIVCYVNGKGLLVASSCSHSGVVNVLRNAQRITGIDKIHAFIGGMHLTGGIFEPIIPQTMDEVADLRPDMIVPGHCTGWKAHYELVRRMPDAYIQSSVGTTISF